MKCLTTNFLTSFRPGRAPVFRYNVAMLYLVATPIGNLGDMTLRAVEVLRAADLILSEDTRTTSVLLNHFDIHRPQQAFHEHNEDRLVPRIMSLLREGQTVALCSDAGTPGISDPGFTLVRAAAAEGLPVTAVPGPAALILAVTLSGLPVHSFTFRGFPPHKRGPRIRFLAVDRESPHTLIFYESPYRLKAFLADALKVYGDRSAALANDLTKKFEWVERAPLSGLIVWADTQTSLRGEFTVVIAGRSERRPAPGSETGEPQDA